MLTRIRRNCSILNGDMYLVNIVANAQCNCDSASEDTQHYVFACPRYNHQRNNLTVSQLLSNLNTDILTHGISEFDTDSNIKIKDAVLKYIKDTQR